MFFAQYDPSTNPINVYGWAFPLLECVHIPSFAFSIGTISLVDFRLLGLAFRKQAVPRLVQGTTWLTVGGLTAAILSGVLLFTTDPQHYYHNGAFRLKVICLALGILFNFTIHRKVALDAHASARATTLVGAVSLAIWITVVFGGVFYSFY